MNTSDIATLLMIKGVISDLAAPDQEKVKQCADQIKLAIKEAGIYGKFALALVGAEVSAEA